MANVAPLMSNYAMGFAQGVSIRGVPLLSAYPGMVFWVDSVNGADGNNGTFQYPLATLAKAITYCTAARGDIIVCKAGHAETISTATALNFSVSGVAVVGLGVGTHRPTITLDTGNTTTITVSAANCSFTNMWFIANFLNIAACFTLTTAKWTTFQNCLWTDTSASLNWTTPISATGAANTADGLTVTDCQFFGSDTSTTTTSLVTIADANAFVTLNRNRVILLRTTDAAALLTVTTGTATRLEMGDNVTVTKQTASTSGTLAKLNASSTGVAYRNFTGSLVTSSDILFTTTVGIFPFENRVSGVVGATGFVIPAVDS